MGGGNLPRRGPQRVIVTGSPRMPVDLRVLERVRDALCLQLAGETVARLLAEGQGADEQHGEQLPATDKTPARGTAPRSPSPRAGLGQVPARDPPEPGGDRRIR